MQQSPTHAVYDPPPSLDELRAERAAAATRVADTADSTPSSSPRIGASIPVSPHLIGAELARSSSANERRMRLAAAGLVERLEDEDVALDAELRETARQLEQAGAAARREYD